MRRWALRQPNAPLLNNRCQGKHYRTTISKSSTRICNSNTRGAAPTSASWSKPGPDASQAPVHSSAAHGGHLRASEPVSDFRRARCYPTGTSVAPDDRSIATAAARGTTRCRGCGRRSSKETSGWRCDGEAGPTNRNAVRLTSAESAERASGGFPTRESPFAADAKSHSTATLAAWRIGLDSTFSVSHSVSSGAVTTTRCRASSMTAIGDAVCVG